MSSPPFRIHTISHIPHEDLGVIQHWLKDKKHKVTFTRTYQTDHFPDLNTLDWIIVLGGPMSVQETHLYPWLTKEKHFIEACIRARKKVLGICLGAQLIGEVLGGRVTKNPYREIGWFKVERCLSPLHPLATIFPSQFEAFHWHSDTFEIPLSTLPLAKSEACQNQGFLYQDQTIALQFHCEVTLTNVQSWIEQGEEEWRQKGPYIQSPEEMVRDLTRFDRTREIMHQLLDYFSR
ncbi:MAG: type 1 glutamine amidotransferase [Gammaproteobacteria bacterium]|nr:type 1 glutamine amidotransferase [Gammaproteobacteria bacterium]